MDHHQFLDLHTAMIEKIKSSGVKMKWYGALAYEMAEKEHIRLYGVSKYASYQSFMSCRSNNKKARYQEPGDTDNDKPDFVPVFKKKRQHVFKRTEWDSKFNWLFKKYKSNEPIRHNPFRHKLPVLPRMEIGISRFA